MQSEPAKPEISSPEDALGSPAAGENPKQSTRETITSTASSFSGLAGSRSGSSGSSSGSTGPKVGLTGAGQTIEVGQTVGRYEIQKVLGSGSMGSVFLARDTQLDRLVALKMLRVGRDRAGELSLRLRREAQAAATLSHPNICPVYDVGDIAGTYFIAMAYIPGRTMSTYIASGKRQREREAAKVVRKVALALHEAHSQGIVHRDLKPANIMIDKRGEPIVMDFGVACWFEDDTQTRLTHEGTLVGTPAYMSPEQIEGRTKASPACDVYSLGVVLYQLLTGRCPFEGTVLNVISQVLHHPAPPASSFRPDLSPAMSQICERAMQKDPAKRFPTMLDFAKALTAFLNGAKPVESPATKVLPPDIVQKPVTETKKAAVPKSMPTPRLQPLPEVPRRKTASRPASRQSGPKSWTAAVLAGGGVAALLIVGAFVGATLFRNRGGSENVSPDLVQRRAADASVTVTGGAAASPSPSSSNQPAKAPVIALAAPAAPRTVVIVPDNVGTASTANASQANGMNQPPLGNTKSPLPITVMPDRNVVSNSASGAVGNPGSLAALPTASASGSGLLARDAIVGSANPRAVAGNTAAARGPELPGPPAGPSSPGLQPRTTMPPASGSRPQPPENGGGPRFHDGGPAKGTTIEQYFKERDVNGDGAIDPMEMPLHVISRADTNKDGLLTLQELSAAYKKRGQRLFGPPTPSEMRRLPRGGGRPPGPGGGPGPPGPPDGFQPPTGQ